MSEIRVVIGVIGDDIHVVANRILDIFLTGAGCTSPRCVYLIDGNKSQAQEMCQTLTDLWPDTIQQLPAPHTASSVVMASQWGKSVGWDVQLANNNSAVIAFGKKDTPIIQSNMFLPISWTTLSERIKTLPHNIQTIGYETKKEMISNWMENLSETRVKRFVPLPEMHHFGPTWDGFSFWRQLFEEVEIRV